MSRPEILWRLDYPVQAAGKFAGVEEYSGTNCRAWLFSTPRGSDRLVCVIDGVRQRPEVAEAELARARSQARN